MGVTKELLTGPFETEKVNRVCPNRVNKTTLLLKGEYAVTDNQYDNIAYPDAEGSFSGIT